MSFISEHVPCEKTIVEFCGAEYIVTPFLSTISLMKYEFVYRPPFLNVLYASQRLFKSVPYFIPPSASDRFMSSSSSVILSFFAYSAAFFTVSELSILTAGTL